jgi:hypothetical protein
VRHGAPSARKRIVKIYSRASIGVALLLSVLLAHLLRHKVTAQLPDCDQCDAEKKRFRLTVAGLWAGVVLLFVVAVGATQPSLGLLALVVSAVALIYSFGSKHATWVQGVLSSDRTTVTLKKVHDDFAGAVETGLNHAAGLNLGAPPVQVAPLAPLAPVATRTILPGR